MALEFYNNKNPEHDEFEVVQALHAQKRLLYPLGTKDEFEWCHVFFVGQSKKDGTVQKNFFAELMRPDSEDEFSVKSCFTLEPGDFDQPGLLLHPPRGQFLADISSYRPVTWVTS